jgi:Fe-S oxidoreductase
MTSEVPFYPLAPLVFFAAVVVFGLQMARHLRVFASARPSSVADHPWQRLKSLGVYAIAQVRMFREFRIGLMHAGIFWGFVLLSVATANRVTAGLVQAILAWPMDGWLWRVVLAVGNILSVAVLIAVLYAAYRRLVTRPGRLTLSRDALVILGLIAAIVATELLAEAFRLVRYGDPYAPAELIARPLGELIATPLTPGAQEAIFAVTWWANIVLISAFMVYLPGSKHLHIATAFFNTAFRKLGPRGELPSMDLEAESATFGVRTIADVGWKDLLDGFTCTECGRCQAECPAWATGKPLNPKAFVMGLRRMAIDAEAGVPLLPGLSRIPWLHPLDAAGSHAHVKDRRDASTRPSPLQRPIVEAAIPYDAVWDCVTCGACVEACPVTIEHVDKIVSLRRNLVLEEGRFPQEVTVAFTNMERHGNPWGQPRSARLDWARGLPFDIPVAADMVGPASAGEISADASAGFEVLYWVGCAAAFDDRNRRVARAVATCLHAAGVRFAVLGPEETCSGDPARRLGNEYLYQLLARANVETLNRYRPPLIVTACPHCFNTIANEYPQFGGHYKVVHHSAFLAKLVASGRLDIGPSSDAGRALKSGNNPGGEQSLAASPSGDGRTVTFHDSCYLSRYNGMLREPRAVLRVVPGLKLREMERNGRQSFCCGAGGGRMWMEETRGSRINAERTRQALETGASSVATACPFCLVMMRDGLAEAQVGDTERERVQVIDIAELLAATLSPATDNALYSSASQAPGQGGGEAYGQP